MYILTYEENKFRLTGKKKIVVENINSVVRYLMSQGYAREALKINEIDILQMSEGINIVAVIEEVIVISNEFKFLIYRDINISKYVIGDEEVNLLCVDNTDSSRTMYIIGDETYEVNELDELANILTDSFDEFDFDNTWKTLAIMYSGEELFN